MDDVVDELQYVRFLKNVLKRLDFQKVLEILNECMEDENVSFNSSQPSTSNIQKASDLSASQVGEFDFFFWLKTLFWSTDFVKMFIFGRFCFFQILKQPTQLFMIPPVKKEKSKDRNSTGGNKFQQPSASPKNAAYFVSWSFHDHFLQKKWIW